MESFKTKWNKEQKWLRIIGPTPNIDSPMQCFQNALAYFATAVSYGHKKFMKSTPEVWQARIRRFWIWNKYFIFLKSGRILWNFNAAL